MVSTRKKPGTLYFTDVARLSVGAVVLTGNYYSLEDNSEERIALLSLTSGRWGGMDLSGIAHAVRCRGKLDDCQREYLILERNRGLYTVTPPSNVQFERIDTHRRGFLMDLRYIGGAWYAVGGNHQIYRQDGSGWRPFDYGVYIPGSDGEAKILLSVDGTASDDIYAVGMNGVVLHYDGISWKRIDAPTNCGLQRVLCVDRNEIYVCGYGNCVYRVEGGIWHNLINEPSETVYWDMALFRGNIFVCTKDTLFRVRGDALEEVNIPVEGRLNFYRMASDGNELWTCGGECLLRFDGSQWERYQFPDNL
ncbi:beta propeller repeat protein [Nitrococcus mobilis]|uniref:Uncharacterized protein n=1 Tax=Nitrococcus mobilis Nb-231 TaxID=314278 RepID=A4BPI6_9GAMM|nr:hypothetical protein [Nitrococcus mobilis]EAR22487.1 hypothetical protein NB231_12144 [Nitrococcus mobilis Nb-231]